MHGFALIIAGLIVGLISGLFNRVPNGKSVKGEIVALQQKPRTSREDFRRQVFHADVEYVVDGVSYMKRVPYASSSFRVGDAMRVVYDRYNPEHAVVRPGVFAYAVCIGLIAAGVASLCGLF